VNKKCKPNDALDITAIVSGKVLYLLLYFRSSHLGWPRFFDDGLVLWVQRVDATLSLIKGGTLPI